MPGGSNLKISEVIEYNKKPGKPSTVKTIKDPGVPRDDYYKSGTIHTGPGEPPSSVSKRTPKPKQVAGKPITSGKLLRPGGPGGGPGTLSSRPSSSRPIPQPNTSQRHIPQAPVPAAQPTPIPRASVIQPRPVPQPLAAVNGVSHSRNDSASSVARAPPPPPPAALPAAQKETYKALYDFAGQSETELTIAKDEIVEVARKEPNGMTSLTKHKMLRRLLLEIILLTTNDRLVAHQTPRQPRTRLDPLRISHPAPASSSNSPSRTSTPSSSCCSSSSHPSSSPTQRHQRHFFIPSRLHRFLQLNPDENRKTHPAGSTD